MLFMLPVMQMNLEREARQLTKEVMFLVLVLEQLQQDHPCNRMFTQINNKKRYS